MTEPAIPYCHAITDHPAGGFYLCTRPWHYDDWHRDGYHNHSWREPVVLP